MVKYPQSRIIPVIQPMPVRGNPGPYQALFPGRVRWWTRSGMYFVHLPGKVALYLKFCKILPLNSENSFPLAVFRTAYFPNSEFIGWPGDPATGCVYGHLFSEAAPLKNGMCPGNGGISWGFLSHPLRMRSAAAPGRKPQRRIGEGYTDIYLPSEGPMRRLCDSLRKRGGGIIATGVFWLHQSLRCPMRKLSRWVLQ